MKAYHVVLSSSIVMLLATQIQHAYAQQISGWTDQGYSMMSKQENPVPDTPTAHAFANTSQPLVTAGSHAAQSHASARASWQHIWGASSLQFTFNLTENPYVSAFPSGNILSSVNASLGGLSNDGTGPNPLNPTWTFTYTFSNGSTFFGEAFSLYAGSSGNSGDASAKLTSSGN